MKFALLADYGALLPSLEVKPIWLLVIGLAVGVYLGKKFAAKIPDLPFMGPSNSDVSKKVDALETKLDGLIEKLSK